MLTRGGARIREAKGGNVCDIFGAQPRAWESHACGAPGAPRDGLENLSVWPSAEAEIGV